MLASLACTQLTLLSRGNSAYDALRPAGASLTHMVSMTLFKNYLNCWCDTHGSHDVHELTGKSKVQNVALSMTAASPVNISSLPSQVEVLH
jgi:hypothetical protein